MKLTPIATLGCALAVLSLSMPTFAGDAEATMTDGRRIYVAADFERYAPRTALEMLQQVPGFVIREQAQERGLGQATGNVLINGQRMSGKSNEVIGELGRIPVQNVVRIEVVDGSTLDVSGLSGLVANVIVKAERINGTYVWRPEFRPYNTDPRFSNFEVSAGGHTGRVEYSLGLDNRSSHGGADGPAVIRNAQGDVIEYRHDQWKSRFNQPRVSGRFVINDLGDSVANINILYRQISEYFAEDGTRSGPGLDDRRRELRGNADGYNYELGADYEFAWGLGRMKFIGLTRAMDVDFSDELQGFHADDHANSGSRFDRTSKESEHILRAEYRLVQEGGEWQFSSEAAFNQLDNTASLFELQDGQFQPIQFSGATAIVEEKRMEIMVGYNRQLRDNLTLQVNAGGEYSRLEQVGADGMTRHFRRPKGTISLAWQLSADTDANLRLQRRVGQLNFYDFLANVNLNDDVRNSANPNLKPPQLWELESEMSTKIGQIGTTTLRAYVHRIDDIVDIIPIGDDGESPGNIDHAWRYGVEWKNTFELAKLGWEGGRIDTRFIWQDSRVEDPLTGETRAISRSLENFASITLRSDRSGSDWAWGMNASYEYEARNVRLTEQGRFWEGPVWANAYIEKRSLFGHTIRATIGNVLGARSMWDRTVYDGRRTDSIAFVEERDRRIGPIFSLSIQGTF